MRVLRTIQKEHAMDLFLFFIPTLLVMAGYLVSDVRQLRAVAAVDNNAR